MCSFSLVAGVVNALAPSVTLRETCRRLTPCESSGVTLAELAEARVAPELNPRGTRVSPSEPR